VEGWVWVQPRKVLEPRLSRGQLFFFEKYGGSWFDEIRATAEVILRGDLIVLAEAEAGHVRGYGRFAGSDVGISKQKRERCANVYLEGFQRVGDGPKLALRPNERQVFRRLSEEDLLALAEILSESNPGYGSQL